MSFVTPNKTCDVGPVAGLVFLGAHLHYAAVIDTLKRFGVEIEGDALRLTRKPRR